MSRPSSPRLGAAQRLRRKRSRLAALLWAAELAILLAAGLVIGVPIELKAAAGAALVALAISTRPRRPATLVAATHGRWSLPERGLLDLELAPGTFFTRRWALLRLVDGAGRVHAELVWADELPAEAWRGLQLRLREPALARALRGLGVIGRKCR